MTGIVPAPTSIEVQQRAHPFNITEGTSIVAAGTALPIARGFAAELFQRHGIVLPVLNEAAEASDAAGIVFAVRESAGEDESYTIAVDESGILVRGASPAGLYRATRSLRQLIASGAGAGLTAPTLTVPALTISDAPRFAYRGVMLDVVRHFFPVENVLHFIDAVALLKINVLHLHLTDDQGWRIHIDSWPELTRIGSTTAVDGAPGGFYTKADYARIVDYAAERFITVVPEIDLPGHTNAALHAYPELNADGIAREPYEGVKVGFSSLSAAPERAEATNRFLADVLREISEMTPGPWLHIGGDESWATPTADYIDLIERITHTAAATGKALIGWREIGASSALPTGTTTQYWSYLEPQEDSAELTLSVVKQGGKVIMSPADVAYLDFEYPDKLATPNGYPLGLDWANGPTSLRDAYAWEPSGIVPGVGEEQLLGVEAPLWAETTKTFEDVEFLVFPRLAALAEIGWSPKPGAERDFDEFAGRVAAFSRHWDAAGIVYGRVDEVPWPSAEPTPAG
jgi:hexosaminidase